MFRSLLRTLPSLSGNFKLACKIDHIDKTYKLNNIDVCEVSIKKCSLQPLQNKMYNRDININLTNNSYEYDICKFYNKYRDKFYDANYIFNETDFKYWNPVVNDDSSVRNKDYEYGCKRLSYYNTGYQFEFYAPIYIDDSNDLPKYFDIYVYFNDYNVKILRINIDNDNESNYLYQYINKYLSKINSNIIYFDDNSQQATYFGLDVLNGGLTSIKDSMVSILYKEQLPINQFNKMINNGFERNKLIMRQIIPLAFQFNIESLLSNADVENFYYKDINIKGSYVNKNNYKLSLYDIEHSGDELYINKNYSNENIMFHNSLYSLYEKQLNIYKYDNKININWNHWKLQLSNEDNPYYTNININYSGVNGKYGNFPTIGTTKQILLNVINTNNIYDIEYFENTDDYIYNLNQNISSWYKLLNCDDYNSLTEYNKEFFNNENNWFDVKNNYAYVNGILYNLKDICTIKNIDKLDYFNVFVYPNFNIIDNFGNSISSNYTIEYSKINNFSYAYEYNFNKHLFYTNDETNTNYVPINISTNNIFIKSTYNLNSKQYIFNKNENNVIYYDIDELIGDDENKESLKESLLEILSEYLINNVYCQISNIYIVKNIDELIKNKNIYSLSNIYYKYSLDEDYNSFANISLNTDLSNLNAKEISLYTKKTFISRTDLLNNLNIIKELLSKNNVNIDNNINNLINNLNKYEMVLANKDIYFKEYTPLATNIYYIDENSNNEGYCRIENEEQFECIKNLIIKEKLDSKSLHIINNVLNISNDEINIKNEIKNIENIEINNIKYFDNGFFKYNGEIVKLYYKATLTKVTDDIIKTIINDNTTYFLYIKELNEDKLKNITEYEISENIDDEIEVFTPIFNSVFNHKDLFHQKNLIENENICYQYINENDETIYESFNNTNKEIVYLNNSQVKYKYIEEISLEDIIKKLTNIIYDDINNKDNLYDKFKIILKLLIDENDYNIIKDLNIKNLTNYDNIYKFITGLLNVLNKYKDIFVGKEIKNNIYSNILFEDVYSKDIVNNIINSDDTDKINKIITSIIINILYGKESNGIIKKRDFSNSKINDDYFIVKFYNYENIVKYKYNVSYRTLLFNILLKEFEQDDQDIYNIKNNNQSLDEFIEIDNINNENNDEFKLKNIILLLKHIYDTNYNHFIKLLGEEYYKLELYELRNNNYFDILDNDDNYVNIFTDDKGKKYGYIIYRPYIDNTINTYNIENAILFNSICSHKFNDNNANNEKIFIKYFNDLVPYLKTNFFTHYISSVNSKYNNMIINPYRYLLEDKYYIDKTKIKPDYKYVDSFSYLSDLQNYTDNNNDIWRLSTYNILKHKNPQKITIYRYMNFISPVFKKVNNIKTYQLKYKKFNYNFDDDNIYLTNINIHTYSPVYVFSDKTDKFYDYLVSKNLPNSITAEYEYEYKSFNDNLYYLLKPSFEVSVEKLLTYEQLLECENAINTYNTFKKYISQFIKTNNYNSDEENKILFLFNKYVVSYHSTSVKLNTYQNKKLYKLKYIFNII